MAQQTIHNGGSKRGIIIAVVVLAVFIAGIAMLGNGSAPDDLAPTATATD